MPWIIDEDRALKQKLQGNFVTNYSTGQQFPIDVYYRFPDPEERERRFPHIAIDLIGIEFEADRAHRALGFIVPGNLEDATPQVSPDVFYMTDNDMPLPWSLRYQLATYARDPWHDRLMQSILYQLFPQEFGFLDMQYYDGTTRRADLLSVVRRDTVDNASKRLYRNIFTVAVSSEFYVYEVQFVQQAIQLQFQMEYGIQSVETATWEDKLIEVT